MIPVSAAWQGRASDPRLKPIHRFSIAGYSRNFATAETGKAGEQAWLQSAGSLRQSVNDLRGESTLGDLSIDVLDKDGAITRDFGSFVFEGKDATFLSGFSGLKESDYALFFTGQIDRLEYKAGVWTFVCKDTNRLVKKIIYDTGDDGFPTSEEHPKTVQGNPLQILLDVLQAEVGLSASEIDTATIEGYRDSIFSGFEFFFKLTTAPEAKEFLEKEIFAPLGGYAFVRSDGKYSVRFFWPLPGTVLASLALNADSSLTVPDVDTSELVNTVKYRFDYDSDEDKFFSETVEIYAASEAKYGQQGQHVVESRGMRSALFGFPLARFSARAIAFRYGDKNPKLKWPSFWPSSRLELGDFVSISHAQIADRRTAKVGITGKFFEVVGRSVDFDRCRAELTLIDAEDIRRASGQIFRWAPDSIADFPAASQAEKDKYMFVADDATGKYSTGVEGHTLA